MIRDEILDFASTIISKAIPQPPKPSNKHDPRYDIIFSEWIAMLKTYGWFIFSCEDFKHSDPDVGMTTIERETIVMTMRHLGTPTEIFLYHSNGSPIEAEHVLPENAASMYWTKSLSEMRKHIKYTKTL